MKNSDLVGVSPSAHSVASSVKWSDSYESHSRRRSFNLYRTRVRNPSSALFAPSKQLSKLRLPNEMQTTNCHDFKLHARLPCYAPPAWHLRTRLEIHPRVPPSQYLHPRRRISLLSTISRDPEKHNVHAYTLSQYSPQEYEHAMIFVIFSNILRMFNLMYLKTRGRISF